MGKLIVKLPDENMVMTSYAKPIAEQLKCPKCQSLRIEQIAPAQYECTRCYVSFGRVPQHYFTDPESDVPPSVQREQRDKIKREDDWEHGRNIPSIYNCFEE